MAGNGKTGKLTTVSTLHYIRLVYRSGLLIAFLIMYLKYRFAGGENVESILEQRPLIISIIWTVFTIEMIVRFLPSRFESPGCQKQFARNYIKTGKTTLEIVDNNAVMLCAILWIALNGIFGWLHMLNILDDGIMILLCLVYSVCDLICILFFCPFQSWFLKNKCCVACRIYNWDYAMMFTPLFFVKKAYTWSLLVLSMGLLLRWEVTYYRHPERFGESTNAYLRCANCSEKLCSHKNQLKRLWKKIAEQSEKRVRQLTKTPDESKL